MDSAIPASARGIARAVAAGEVSAAAVIEFYLARATEIDPRLHVYNKLIPEEARAAAAAIDAERARGGILGPLAGVPVVLKDNICTRGVATTCSSRILENFVPFYDATVTERFKSAGAVLLGKTNMDEFAMGSSTENSAFGATRNPWNTACVPGGSSGGSAAAAAAGLAPLALGSDTGGSIRQPAALCGVVGLKPTYGRVSRYGLVAFASSLDQIGPLARDVEDVALALGVIAGGDPRDSTCSPLASEDYLAEIGAGVRGLRVGLVEECDRPELRPEMRATLERAVALLVAGGAQIERVSLPHLPYATAVYYILASSEASSNLARFDGVRYGFRASGAKTLKELYLRSRSLGFGPEVKRRIMLGTFALSSGYYEAYYGKAQAVTARLREDYRRAFERVDLLLTPTTPAPAFKLGEKTADPLEMYLSDIFTVPANLAGLPGLSLPTELEATGLPLAVQMMGRPMSEGLLLRAARTLEEGFGFAENYRKLA